jgi:hypothetical protein
MVELNRKLSRPFFGSLNGFVFRLVRNGPLKSTLAA